tara:strand:+ start:512 stop:844 length:333 start_codon:yes stop_codon:yes gene_type:complete
MAIKLNKLQLGHSFHSFGASLQPHETEQNGNLYAADRCSLHGEAIVDPPEGLVHVVATTIVSPGGQVYDIDNSGGWTLTMNLGSGAGGANEVVKNISTSACAQMQQNIPT